MNRFVSALVAVAATLVILDQIMASRIWAMARNTAAMNLQIPHTIRRAAVRAILNASTSRTGKR
jgi:hypothetical protein